MPAQDLQPADEPPGPAAGLMGMVMKQVREYEDMLYFGKY